MKNKNRKKTFMMLVCQSPPEPVITRWAIWLRAFYFTVKTFQLFVPLSTFRQVQASWSERRYQFVRFGTGLTWLK